MNDGDWQLNFEVLAGGGKGKLGAGMILALADILE